MVVAVKRTGPVVERQCGYCEGQGAVERDEGLQQCPCCGGAGYESAEVRPFVTLEAAMEHVQSVRVAMRLQRTEDFKPPIGSPAYHLDAAEDYIASLFQQLVVLLPEEHERTEGQ